MPAKRRDAEANRDRILRAAQELLSRNPAASMDDLAQAAGVVRRTVYAHFPTRDALLDGLSDKVSAHLLAALGGTDRSGLEPEVALADFALTVWTVGAEYRLLMTLAEADLGGASRLHELLAPIRARGVELLVRGRASGRFATHLPPGVLTLALQGMTLSMIQAVNEGVWSDDGTGVAVAVLIAAGLGPGAAEKAVEQARNLKVAHD
ncbi:TetR/AcrR family transcriptional regulator [Actinoplanes oblitus]|uniref:TetR/AcrR family transcriptional regulator n=1 Tax=Actinoplanes oblitus TaxID=3040509 RepID=A0ABY8WJH6_9ACTN|nr:TetR/AcrR family transcriptional regulator [Actinoplanes oblitus]WIM97010.1 TetR/AcrR family transcriptional regulator [Actinoplanes oblitus]